MGVTIHPRYLERPAALDVAAVRELCAGDPAGATPVGSCSCGGYVWVECPVRSWVKGGPVWVQLVCGSCGRDTACPDGKLLPFRDTA